MRNVVLVLFNTRTRAPRSRLFSAMPLGYGLMLGSCSHTGLFMILAGLVLQTHYSLAEAFQVGGVGWGGL